MDLLREHYGSDSDGSGSGDNEEGGGDGNASQDVPAARRSCCASSVSGGSDRGDGRRGGRKRPRPATAAIETARQGKEERKPFVRAVPHTPGNWNGHIFFPLAPSSAGISNGSKYDATNRVASRRLYLAAEELIKNFATTLKERCLEQKNKRSGGCDNNNNNEVGDALVVSHLPPLPLEQDDSSSDDEDDDESSASSDDKSVEEGDRCSNRRLSREDRREGRTDSIVPLHISLSRPFYLQQQSISTFVEHVRRVLAPHSPTPITFDLSNPEILVNDEKTRTFLTIPAAQISQDAPIVRMIRSVDTVMKRFGQRHYYKEAKIHTSIASVSGDVRDLLQGTLCRGELGVGGKHDDPIRDVSRPTQYNRATFMLDQVMLTFGTTKEHCILLEGN